MSAVEKRLLRISGRVQGVGYRWALCETAQRLGLTGWVRNRTDGTVEALVCGPSPAVDSLIAWAANGPPAARVERVTQTRIEDENPTPTEFSARSTV